MPAGDFAYLFEDLDADDPEDTALKDPEPDKADPGGAVAGRRPCRWLQDLEARRPRPQARDDTPGSDAEELSASCKTEASPAPECKDARSVGNGADVSAGSNSTLEQTNTCSGGAVAKEGPDADASVPEKIAEGVATPPSRGSAAPVARSGDQAANSGPSNKVGASDDKAVSRKVLHPSGYAGDNADTKPSAGASRVPGAAAAPRLVKSSTPASGIAPKSESAILRPRAARPESKPKPGSSDRRLNPEEGRVYQYSFFSRRFAGHYNGAEIEEFWNKLCKPCACVPTSRRVLVLRHGSRPDAGADPPLHPHGHQQATWAAAYLAKELQGPKDTASHIKAIFCSPFTRALQTAVPVAKALDLPIFMEWGFSELLAHNWLHNRDPLPALHARPPRSLPGWPLLDFGYENVVEPEYPDVTGRLTPGDHARRKKPLDRHAKAVRAALDKAAGGSLLVVAHGSTHDFVMGALCPERHPTSLHTPACVPHCGITEIVEDEPGDWRPLCFGDRPWTPPGYKDV